MFLIRQTPAAFSIEIFYFKSLINPSLIIFHPTNSAYIKDLLLIICFELTNFLNPLNGLKFSVVFYLEPQIVFYFQLLIHSTAAKSFG